MNRYERGFSIGSIVRHFKGKVYRIEDFARHTETGELLVIYRQMYAPFYCFARPEEVFCSKIDKNKYPDEKQEYRFEKLSLKEAREMNESIKTQKEGKE